MSDFHFFTSRMEVEVWVITQLNHNIRLKVGALLMLLRNIDQISGLCDGTRLVVNHLSIRVIEATIISGSNALSKKKYLSQERHEPRLTPLNFLSNLRDVSFL